MPVYQVSYDNINTEVIKAALFDIVERAIKDDSLLTVNDPICHAQSSVWLILTNDETTGTYLLSLFEGEDIIVTKIYSRASIKAGKEEVKAWLEAHIK